MDGQTAIPQGATLGGTTDPQNTSTSSPTGSPIPQGATLGGATAPTNASNGPTGNNDSSSPVGYDMLSAGKDVLEGAGKGLLSTVAGGVHAVNKLDTAIGGGAHQIGTQTLDKLAGTNEPMNTAQKIGYGGETLMEFLMGDEAIKGLSLADKLGVSAKIAATLQKSPRIMKAVQLGAEALGMGARAGVVQGAQTTARTGGNVEQGAKEGLETGVTAGVLGGGVNLLAAGGNKVAEIVSKAAQDREGLQTVADQAKTAEQLKKAIGDQLDTAKEQLHKGYDADIESLKTRMGNATIEPEGSPLETKAKEILGENPDPSEHPDTAATREAKGEGLKPKVKAMLEQFANRPEETEAAAPESWVDANGVTHTEEAPAAEAPEPKAPYTLDDLIQQRQNIRATAQNFETGDINSRVLVGHGGLLSAVDDTIQKLADSANDPDLGADYKAIRAAYGTKIRAFQEPVIQALRDGKPDDAARAFLSGTKQGYNVQTLKDALGPAGTTQFSKQVFTTMLKESADENGNVNAARFLEKANKIKDAIKSGFFDMQGANNGLQKLYSDAQSVANVQRLTRAGLLSAAGSAVGATGGAGIFAGHGVLGALLGLTVAEGTGNYMKTARDLLDYVANNPKTWAALKAAPKVVEGAGKVAKTGANVVAKGATDLANQNSDAANGALLGLGAQVNTGTNKGTQ